MEEPIAAILTTIGLNILKKIGVEKSVVFSSLFLFSSLTNYSLDTNEPLPEDIIRGAPNLELTEVAGKLNELVAEVEDKNLSYPIWKYPLPIHETYHFRTFNHPLNLLTPMKFMSMDQKYNWEVSCENQLIQWTMDNTFKVLSIPMCQEHYSFVVTQQRNYLEPLLENLNPKKFLKLMYDLSPGFVHFKIPMFKINSTIHISKVLGLRNHKSLFSQKFKFKMTDDSEKCEEISEGRRIRSMLNHPCETIPVYFPVNRPFIFAVMKENIPLVMGFFKGD